MRATGAWELDPTHVNINREASLEKGCDYGEMLRLSPPVYRQTFFGRGRRAWQITRCLRNCTTMTREKSSRSATMA